MVTFIPPYTTAQAELESAKRLAVMVTPARLHVVSELQPIGLNIIERIPHLETSPSDIVDSTSPINVRVYADTHRERPGEHVEPIRVELPSAKSQCDLLSWLSVSDNLTILGETQKYITLKANESKSSVAEFTISRKPDTSPDEECGLVVYFSYNGRAAGKVERRSRLADLENLPIPNEPDDNINVDETAPEPDITIFVLNEKKNNYELKCICRTPWLQEYREGVSEAWYLSQNSGDLIAGYFSAFLADSNYEQRYEALIGGGKLLFQSLPERCQEMFWKLKESGRTVTTMSIVSQEPYIPWELMIPTRRLDNGDFQEDRPLGVTYAIGRWILSGTKFFAAPCKIRIRGSYVIAPIYIGAAALDAASDEAKFVCDNFHGTMIKPADPSTINSMLQAHEQNLLHFACHGSSDVGGRIGRQVLELQDSSTIDSIRLNGMKGMISGLRKGKPLIFLNACTAGQSIPTLSGMGGLASSFVDLGASGVVAPLWNVDDKIARQVAVSFYKIIKENPTRSLASIVRDVRALAYDEGQTQGRDTYAAYCYYGDPSAVVDLPTEDVGDAH